MSWQTSLTNASSAGTERKLREIERRTSPSGPQRLEMAAGLAQHRDVGVAEAVDRLLAVADDEDRRLERTGVRQAGAFAPRLHQQRHQLPLRAARVLELVDEHVVIARLEPVAALRELLHLPQQVERAQQHVGEVEHRVRVERAPILGLGDARTSASTPRETSTFRSRR